MTKSKTWVTVAIVLSLVLFAVIYQVTRRAPSSAPVIGLVVTTIGNPYFSEMIAAAQAEAEKTPRVVLSVQAPERGAVDPERQQQIVTGLIGQHVAALLIVPADSRQIVSALAVANDNNVPVIVLDNKIDVEAASARHVQIKAFIGTDNLEGGRVAGQFMAESLQPEGGDVAILEGVPGVQAAVDRAAGFRTAIAKAGDLRIVASQAADWDRDKAYAATRSILIAHPGLRGIFGANDEMAVGAARAVADSRLNRQIVIVGYDATPDGRSAAQSGMLAGTVAQDPATVGRLGVQMAKDIIAGQPVPATTTIPVSIYRSPAR